MPAYDYRCTQCDLIHETFYRMNDKPKTIPCPECGGESVSHPSIGAILGDEAAWLNSVREVVDPSGGEHCQRFLRDPSRANYKDWMQKSNLRHLEPGEERRAKPSKAEREREKKARTDKAMKALHEARKVTVKP